MSSRTVYNLLRNSDLTRNVLTAVTTAATGKAATYRVANWGNASKPTSDSSGLHFTGPTYGSSPNSGVGVEFAASDLGLVNGDTYVLSVEVASLAAADANNGLAVWQHSSEEGKWWTGKATRSKWSSGAGVYRTSFAYDGSAYVYLLMSVGQSGSATVTRFGLYHAASAAWAPAEGETLVGVGALMSANLWNAATANKKPDADGVYLVGKSTDELKCTIAGASAFAENQTVHMGASLRGAGKGCLKPFVEYRDAEGNLNWVGFPAWTPNAEWQRFEATCVVPSGMTITKIGFNTSGATGDIEVLNPAFSYGSPVCLASSAHTPYATQDHVSVTYATKASLKVTDDSIKAEVSARAQTDQNVADLSSRLTQTANSLTSEISDRKSAITTVTGLANAAQSTAQAAASDAATAKTNAASAVSTANSASTSAANAVETANAASSTASSASSTANSAASTANAAKTSAASAVSTANAASSTANTAQTTADAAQSTADAAKDAIDNLEIGGRNLYIRSTTVPGYLSAGATDNINSPSSVTKERTSDYISIDANSAYVLQSWFDDSDTSQYSWMCLHWYTDNKEPISEAAREHMQGLVYRKRLLTSPANAAYARISARFQEIDEWRQKIKFEKGNKSTDWTPAPEDTDSAVADAKKAGTDAQSLANAAQTMATENQSSIKQLSNSITSEVTQRTKTDQMVSDLSSRLTQTADGFSASIDRLSDTDKKVNSWFGFGADSSGNPQLTMGSSSSPVVGVYTNTGLAYRSRSGATLLELDGASRSSTMPHVHADDVSIGSWQWVPTQNGTHFTLQWIGG